MVWNPSQIGGEQNMTTKSLEQKCRRVLRKEGYRLCKSRSRNWKLDDQLGYMIIYAPYNYVVAGSRFDLSLDDVVEFTES